MPAPDRDATQIAERAAAAGLDIDPRSISFNEMGLDFRVGFATSVSGERWVLRLPRRPEVMERASREAATLAVLRPLLPFAIPDWQVFGPDLIAYPMLPGQPGLTFDATTYEVTWHLDRASKLFPQSLGAAIAALHAVDRDAARRSGMPVFAPAQLRQKWRDDLALVDTHFEIPRGRLSDWQRWIADDGCWPDFTVPIHGDLYAGHVMVDEQGRVIGMIDWTEARIGDPAADLVGHLKAFDKAALAELIGAYCAAGGRVWARVEEHCHKLHDAAGVAYALFALTTDDAEHTAAAQAQLTGEHSEA